MARRRNKNAGPNAGGDPDKSLSENLVEQFAAFYVLSVLAVELLEIARAQRRLDEAAAIQQTSQTG